MKKFLLLPLSLCAVFAVGSVAEAQTVETQAQTPGVRVVHRRRPISREVWLGISDEILAHMDLNLSQRQRIETLEVQLKSSVKVLRKEARSDGEATDRVAVRERIKELDKTYRTNMLIALTYQQQVTFKEEMKAEIERMQKEAEGKAENTTPPPAP